MDAIALTKFGGEIPRLPAHMLPEHAAQQAVNCDFTHGYLAPLKQGFLISTMSTNVKSIYTEDGIYFYTWASLAYPQKSPVMKDPYNRVYYIDGGVLRVTTTAGMLTSGGAPSSSWKVGVPRPTTPPGVALVDRTTLRDYPSATWSLETWHESGSKRYQQTTPSLTTVTAYRAYTFAGTAPDVPSTPADAVVRATLKLLDSGGKPVLTVTMTAGGPEARSTALPGGVGFALTSTGGNNYRIDLSWGVAETRAYTYTCRNTWDEESPPSPPSQIATTYMQDVAISLAAVGFSGYRPLSAYCVYRTMGAVASYLRIEETSDTTFTDTSSKAQDVLGSLDTLDYEEPPPLNALVRLANGSLAGYSGNMLYISEVYRPHTWQYQIAFPKAIRGLLDAPGSLLVTTAEFSYAVLGSDPASMQPTELPVPQAGVSPRSMAKLDNQVVFASKDGFVSVVGAAAGMKQSQELFARDDWRARYGAVLDDASLCFAYHDGALVATSSSQAKGFVLRTDESVGGQMTQFNQQFGAMFYLPVADTLYYSQGANVYQFRGGDPYSYTWHSRDWIFSEPRNLGAGYLRCSPSQQVTLTLYIDGAQWWTGTVGNGYFRLPSGRKGLRWSVKLQGSAHVYELALASNMGGLKRV